MSARGQQVNTPGLVLRALPHKERDKVSLIYTEEFGKVPARFIGVSRPEGKLKALAEPMTWAEFRLYIRDGAEFGVATGGAVSSVFAGLRAQLDAMLRGMQIVELLDRMTPVWKPGPEKLTLAVGALAALDAAAREGKADSAFEIVGAFALRLFDLAGYGLGEKRVSEEGKAVWEVLHHGSWEEVARLRIGDERRGRLDGLIRNTVERVTERPLRSAMVIDSVGDAL